MENSVGKGETNNTEKEMDRDKAHMRDREREGEEVGE